MVDARGQGAESERTVADRIVLGAIEAFRAHAFRDVDAVAVGAAAGVPVAVVEQAFPIWDALLLVTYDRWTEERAAARRSGTGVRPASVTDHIRVTLAEDVADPGLVRVLAGVLEIVGANTSFAALFRKRYEEYFAVLLAGLEREFAASPDSLVVSAGHAATQLLALYQGLQIQLLVRPHVDVLQQYDIAVQTLRSGWESASGRTWSIGAEPAEPAHPTEPADPA